MHLLIMPVVGSLKDKGWAIVGSCDGEASVIRVLATWSGGQLLTQRIVQQPALAYSHVASRQSDQKALGRGGGVVSGR